MRFDCKDCGITLSCSGKDLTKTCPGCGVVLKAEFPPNKWNSSDNIKKVK